MNSAELSIYLVIIGTSVLCIITGFVLIILGFKKLRNDAPKKSI